MRPSKKGSAAGADARLLRGLPLAMTTGRLGRKHRCKIASRITLARAIGLGYSNTGARFATMWFTDVVLVMIRVLENR